MVEGGLHRVVVERAAGAADQGVEDVDRPLDVLEHVRGQRRRVVAGDLTTAVALEGMVRGEQGNLSTAA
jgi:hypothetical protein